MTPSLARDAHAVLFPAFDALSLDDDLRRYLAAGGASLLLGESREEYVARDMSTVRKAAECAADIERLTTAARAEVGDVLFAVDQELAGIQRLHGLVPALPSIAEARAMTEEELALACQRTAEAARGLGVNMFLAPIVDVVTEADHPWLGGRHLGSDAVEVGRLATAFVRGVQQGGIAAAAKHFPGYPALRLDPALEKARLSGTRADLDGCLSAFRSVIDAGVLAVMLGPAVVEALDMQLPASLSPTVVKLLRHDLGFSGLIISDDLDAKGILLDRSLEEVAVMALVAGAELLLVAAGDHLEKLATAIQVAVQAGRLPEETLASAARKVRALAARR